MIQPDTRSLGLVIVRGLKYMIVLLEAFLRGITDGNIEQPKRKG